MTYIRIPNCSYIADARANIQLQMRCQVIFETYEERDSAANQRSAGAVMPIVHHKMANTNFLRGRLKVFVLAESSSSDTDARCLLTATAKPLV